MKNGGKAVHKAIITSATMMILLTIPSLIGMSMPNTPQGKGQPVIPKLSQFRGDIFKNFAEFRVQHSKFDTKGIITLQEAPYKMLINCSNIIKVHRFEDGKETDYSCLMFIIEHRHSTQKLKPILVRETYTDVLRKMKRAIESR